jgi:hypothetical protein
MTVVALRCPSCGASLPPQSGGGDCICAYCQHTARVLPVRDPHRPDHVAALQAQLGQFAARRPGPRPLREVERRLLEEETASRRNGALIVGGLGLAAIGISVAVAVATGKIFPGPGPILVPLGAFLGLLGIYNLVAVSRINRLRATGIPGCGTIATYKRTMSGFDLTLRIDLPGRDSYEVKMPNAATGPHETAGIATGVALSVIVSESNPNDVLIEWF